MADTDDEDESLASEKSATCILNKKEVYTVLKGLALATLPFGKNIPTRCSNSDNNDEDSSSDEPDEKSGDKTPKRGLSETLKDSFELDLDCLFDLRHTKEWGYPIELEGFIAHNDKTIVLSYHLRKPAIEWVEAFDCKKTAWKLGKEHSNPFADFYSTLCADQAANLMVHADFDRNFRASLPYIKKHITPLLSPYQPRRKLLVVGHSLAAGVATMATCYFMFEFDWSRMPHKLVSVSGGGPRSCNVQMKELIEERLMHLGQSVNLFRVVHSNDIVPTMPPQAYGFRHMGPAIEINDEIIVSKKEDGELDTEYDSSFVAFRDLNSCDCLFTKREELEKPLATPNKSLASHNPTAYLKPFVRITMERMDPEVKPEVEIPEYNQDEYSQDEAETTDLSYGPNAQSKHPRKNATWWKKLTPKVRQPTSSKINQTISISSVQKSSASETSLPTREIRPRLRKKMVTRLPMKKSFERVTVIFSQMSKSEKSKSSVTSGGKKDALRVLD